MKRRKQLTKKNPKTGDTEKPGSNDKERRRAKPENEELKYWEAGSGNTGPGLMS